MYHNLIGMAQVEKEGGLGVNYLDGCIYHMVHFDTLKSIFLRQAILSKEKVLQERRAYQSIANDEVQNLRDRIFVLDPVTRHFKRLHGYVPFYFATHPPMLYIQFRDGIQNKIALLEVERSILRERGVLFTDGNASNQQLSRGSETVRIIPAFAEKSVCSRQYSSGTPVGTNTNRSNFYGNIKFLSSLNWTIINKRQVFVQEEIRIKHAEVLVPNMLSLGQVQNIYVNNHTMLRDVNALIVQGKLKGRIPFATYRPDLFF